MLRAAHRHVRFLAAFGVGLALWFASRFTMQDQVMRLLVAVNGGYVLYLGQIVWMTMTTTVDDLRRHSEQEDEGSTLIFLLALVAVIVGVSAIFLALNRKGVSMPESFFALSAAPLGWALLHAVMAFRYANLYYRPTPDEGLSFPGPTGDLPGVTDFLYFAFTIGMTAQVSDVEVTTKAMRQTVLLHSILSFFYNTVILALSVNAAVAMTS